MSWSHWLNEYVERNRPQSAMSGLVFAIFRGFSVHESSVAHAITTYICATLSGQEHVCAYTRIVLDFMHDPNGVYPNRLRKKMHMRIGTEVNDMRRLST